MILANAYHIYLRPGDEMVRALGGLPPIRVGTAAEVVLVHAALRAGYRVAHVPAALSWRCGPASGTAPEAVLREHACAAGAALLAAVGRERRA
ncbi:MAG: hypothetical protein KY464_18735, partial [Gemmatimonadetes bacterium]|nr:hypothetical protein [Gemmatimonadota bacterium]